jgi:hypothetical protein
VRRRPSSTSRTTATTRATGGSSRSGQWHNSYAMVYMPADWLTPCWQRAAGENKSATSLLRPSGLEDALTHVPLVVRAPFVPAAAAGARVAEPVRSKTTSDRPFVTRRACEDTRSVTRRAASYQSSRSRCSSMTSCRPHSRSRT